MTVGTRLFTWLRGELVGEDSQGNRYYRERKTIAGRRQKRWVIYRGEAEASRVPPEWHAWLHSKTLPVPTTRATPKSWQKPHEPNRTGTDLAYRPPGHTLMGGNRAKATGDYEPWTPA